jgi:hypothetical protein
MPAVKLRQKNKRLYTSVRYALDTCGITERMRLPAMVAARRQKNKTPAQAIRERARKEIEEKVP